MDDLAILNLLEFVHTISKWIYSLKLNYQTIDSLYPFI